MILAVTGHRPPKLGGYNLPNPVADAVMQALDEAFMRLRPERVYTGLALGVDQWAADICFANDIPYIAVIPFDGYGARWPEESQATYRLLLSRARSIRCLAREPPDGANVDGLIRTRNRYLIAETDALLAVFNGDAHSGTGQTVRIALQNNKPVHSVELSADIWAQARIRWDRTNARQQFNAAIQAARAVEPLQRRVNRTERVEPARRYSRVWQEEQDAFAQHFPSVVAEANQAKRHEKLKEDVTNLKPRRVIDIGED